MPKQQPPPKPHDIVTATADHALTWTHALADIPARGYQATLSASPQERLALAAELGIIEVTSLDVSYRMTVTSRRRDANNRTSEVRLKGELTAGVVQACVATLEPVPATIVEPINVDLRSASDIDPAAEIDPLEEADLEPLDPQDAVPLGRIIYDILAAALDPFPRAAGAEFKWADTSDAGDAASRPSPFAALAHLKDAGAKGKKDE